MRIRSELICWGVTLSDRERVRALRKEKGGAPIVIPLPFKLQGGSSHGSENTIQYKNLCTVLFTHRRTPLGQIQTHKFADIARKYTLCRQWKRNVSNWHLYQSKHSPHRIPFTETKSSQWLEIVPLKEESYQPLREVDTEWQQSCLGHGCNGNRYNRQQRDILYTDW